MSKLQNLGSKGISTFKLFITYKLSQLDLQSIQSFVTIISSFSMEISTKISSNSRKLKFSDFKIVKMLGQGAFGEVQLAQYKGINYAIKIIGKTKLAKSGKQYQAFVQKEILMKLRNPGIYTLQTCFQDHRNLYFVLEHCEGGNLKQLISQRFGSISPELRRLYVGQLVKTIGYLQSVQVVHRDLKPQNIFISDSGHLKIGDFATAEFQNCSLISESFKDKISQKKKLSGYLEPIISLTTNNINKTEKEAISSEEIEKTNSNQSNKDSYSSNDSSSMSLFDHLIVNRRRKATFVGTCCYISPELLQSNECGFATDLWALGCIIYELYYGINPFEAGNQYETFQKIKATKVQYPDNGIITPEAIDLIKKLLQKNPEHRLGCNSHQGLMYTDLLKHKYFECIEELLARDNDIFMSDIPKVSSQNYVLEQRSNNIQKSYCKKTKNSDNNTEKQIKQSIIFQGIIQKRTFINYNKYYLALMKDLTMYRIKISEPQKIRKIKIPINLSMYAEPAQLSGEPDFFQLTSEDKVYKFKTADAEKWVEVINSAFTQYITQHRADQSSMIGGQIKDFLQSIQN